MLMTILIIIIALACLPAAIGVFMDIVSVLWIPIVFCIGGMIAFLFLATLFT